MIDGEEHRVSDARCARKHTVGRHPREAFVDQMLVRRTAAEVFRIRRAGIAVAGLDEYQRYRGIARRSLVQMERAIVMFP